MKKQLVIIFIFLVFSSAHIFCRNGGDAALGGFAGSMVGSVVGSAMTQGGRDSRARQEAREARKEAELIRREQQRERIERLEQEALKKSINEKNDEIRLLLERLRALEGTQKNGHNTALIGFLIGLSIILFLFIIALGVLLVRKKY